MRRRVKRSPLAGDGVREDRCDGFPVDAGLRQRSQLSADLIAWCDQSAHRDDALRDARATTVTARDAAEALREALARLDLEVERAAGGTRSTTYTAWVAVAGQLG